MDVLSPETSLKPNKVKILSDIVVYASKEVNQYGMVSSNENPQLEDCVSKADSNTEVTEVANTESSENVVSDSKEVNQQGIVTSSESPQLGSCVSEADSNTEGIQAANTDLETDKQSHTHLSDKGDDKGASQSDSIQNKINGICSNIVDSGTQCDSSSNEPKNTLDNVNSNENPKKQTEGDVNLLELESQQNLEKKSSAVKQQPQRKRKHQDSSDDEDMVTVFNYMTGLYETVKKSKMDENIIETLELSDEMTVEDCEEKNDCEENSAPKEKADSEGPVSNTESDNPLDTATSTSTPGETSDAVIDLTDDNATPDSNSNTNNIEQAKINNQVGTNNNSKLFNLLNSTPSTSSPVINQNKQNAEVKKIEVATSILVNASNSNLICLTCNYKAVSKQQLIYHLYKAHLRSNYLVTFKCKVCGYSTHYEKLIQLHKACYSNGKTVEHISVCENVEIKVAKKARVSNADEVEEAVELSDSDEQDADPKKLFKCLDCGSFETRKKASFDEHLTHHVKKQSVKAKQQNDNKGKDGNLKLFKCPHCSYFAPSKLSLKSHISKNHHKLSNQNCRLCINGSIVCDVEKLKFACDLCHRSTFDIADHLAHKRICQKNNRKILPKPSSVRSYTNVDFERAVNSSNNPHENYNCFHCNYVGKSRTLLKMHALQHYKQIFLCISHENGNVDGCSQCLYQTVLKELQAEVLLCHDCGFKTSRKAAFTRHRSNKENCKNFLSSNTVELSDDSNTDDDSLGQKATPSDKNELKKFSCSLCSFVHDDFMALLIHRIRVHNESGFRTSLNCFDCNNFTTNKIQTLREHSLKHSKKEFCCDQHHPSAQNIDCGKCLYVVFKMSAKRDASICKKCQFQTLRKKLFEEHSKICLKKNKAVDGSDEDYVPENDSSNIESSEEECERLNVPSSSSNDQVKIMKMPFPPQRQSPKTKRETILKSANNGEKDPGYVPEKHSDCTSVNRSPSNQKKKLTTLLADQSPDPGLKTTTTDKDIGRTVDNLNTTNCTETETTFNVPFRMQKLETISVEHQSETKSKANEKETSSSNVNGDQSAEEIADDMNFENQEEILDISFPKLELETTQAGISEHQDVTEYTPEEIAETTGSDNQDNPYRNSTPMILTVVKVHFDYECFDCEFLNFGAVNMFEKHIKQHKSSTFNCSQHSSFDVYCKRCLYQYAIMGIKIDKFICRFCSYKRRNLEPVLIHMKGNCAKHPIAPPTEKQKHKCYDCGVENSSREALWTHSLRHQSKYECYEHRLERKKSCSKCSYTSLVQRHWSYRGFSCFKCWVTVKSQYDFRVHIEENHLDQLFNVICSEHPKNPSSQKCNQCLFKEILKVIRTPIRCLVCNSYAPKIRSHVVEKHRTVTPNCPEHLFDKDYARCTKCYTERILEEICGGRSERVCCECDYKCEEIEELELHVNINHFESTFQCDKHTLGDIDPDCDMCLYENIVVRNS